LLLLLLLLCRRHHLLFLSMLSGLSTSFVLFALLPSPSYVRWDITMLPSFAYLLTSIRGDSRSSCGCSSSSTSRGQPTPPLHYPPSAPSLPRLSCALLPRCVHSRTMDPDYTAWSSYAQATPCFPHVHPFAWCHVAPKHQGTKRST
jgi:hypothetical protein